jgi:hypothetical protein
VREPDRPPRSLPSTLSWSTATGGLATEESCRPTGLTGKAIDLREWFLLGGNRLVIAGGVVILIFGLLSVAEWTGLILLTETMPMFYLFSSLIGGNPTLITVVVSINQLLLSREFSSPGELQ